MEKNTDSFKNIKDNTLFLKDNSLCISYSKISKLITALYMVTDIMDTNEPLRSRLRELGSKILSDTYSLFLKGPFSFSVNKPSVPEGLKLLSYVIQVLSFLEIASTLQMISVMNFNILNKEFVKLKNSVEEYQQNAEPFKDKTFLSDFFTEDKLKDNLSVNNEEYSIGHPTRIGVQKGSTLMKALSDKIFQRPIDKTSRPLKENVDSRRKKHSFENKNRKNENSFILLKKQRQDEIIRIIKSFGIKGASITDIREKVKDIPIRETVLITCSEKTLQRELVSMVKNHVLKKTGTKRWSRYFLNKRNNNKN